VRGVVVGRVSGILLSRIRPIMVAVASVAAVVVLGALALDVGEVVILRTTDEHARTCETQLWIVDLDGELFLRAARPDARWLARLRRMSQAVLLRRGMEGVVRAQPEDDVATRERVNAAMRKKYGLADRLWRVVSDSSRSVPIRLGVVREVHASHSRHGEEGVP
jgi:hypothetical protein